MTRDQLTIRRHETLEHRQTVRDFDVLDARTGRRIDGGRGFASEISRDRAIEVAIRRVCGEVAR